MERRSFGRFSLVTAIAFALLALVSYPAASTLAQDDVVVGIGQQDDSGISGDASLTDNGDNTTTVDILVDGATGGHPAGVYNGTCDALGEAAYPLTAVDASGESVTVVDAALSDLTTGGPYVIAIQLSSDDTTLVACGSITQEAVGGETTSAATESTPTPQGSPAAVGGTSSVTDIGASGVGTTFGSSMSLVALALGAAAVVALAGAFSLRRREERE